ncbi:MAG: 4-hydroxy-tetrahydrodipicolinate reductase [Prevotella sp.]|nr:4-hydroxy-tetrahydrodipicolinate reductase [Prevotella sp.]
MKIAIIGYGKMGGMIEEIARSRGHEIVSIIDVDNQEDFTSEAFRSADVAIEFTTPGTAYANCRKAWDAGVKVVSGTTGWIDRHEKEVDRACKEEGKTLFWSSNFSVGVAVFAAVNKYLARIMNAFPQYDVEETEVHHVHKLDHPSGTAITLAEQIVSRLDRKTAWQPGTLTRPDGQVVTESEPKPDLLTVNSIRRGEVPGIHSITYNSVADSITITHDAHSRRGFALGAVLAAEYTLTHAGRLNISDMFVF